MPVSKPLRCYDYTTIIYNDLVSGVTRSEIMRKLTDGEYECIPSTDKSRTWRYNLLQSASERFKIDNEPELQRVREEIATRYYKIYELALKRGNLNAANTAMANLSKLLGTDAPEKIAFDDININLV